VARDRDEHFGNAPDTGLEVGLDDEVIGKWHTRQVTLVFAVPAESLEVLAITTPEPHEAAAACKLQRERGAPGARAKNRDRL